jgi:porphyrinogen peroxidase
MPPQQFNGLLDLGGHSFDFCTHRCYSSHLEFQFMRADKKPPGMQLQAIEIILLAHEHRWRRIMTTPQNGIFIEGSRHHHFLEYHFNPGFDRQVVVDAITATQRAADASPCNLVIAFGHDAWRQLAPQQMPGGLRDFQAITGPQHKAPATQRDLMIWIHGEHHDSILDLAMAAHAALAVVGTAELDLPGFIYHDARDLTGFIDGTANPKDNSRMDAALIPTGQPGAGGAFVLSQRWVHDLDAFNHLSIEDQQCVIGRTKPDSIELEGDAMPAWSHVSRTDVKINGVAQKIYRRSAPYGTATEQGLYFLAFACDIQRFQVQLDRMFGVSGDGDYDHLIDYSRAVSGSYWFAPSETMLSNL